MKIDAKYVVIDDNDFGPTMYIFPFYINHAKFTYKNIKHRGDVISAGFIHITCDNYLYVHGRSVSLNKESRPIEDARLATKLLYGAMEQPS